MARAGLSVVVPTRDRPDRLERCLAALRAALRDGDELLVVDSASSSDEPARVAIAGGATVLRESLPGASRARNRGWRAARHELIAFVDDDVTVTPGWADAMVAAFDRDDEVARRGEVAFVAGRCTPPPHQADAAHPVALVPVPVAARIDADTRGVLGASANLGVRRAALEAVGGFDEGLGPGAPVPAAEDLDLLDRLVESGAIGRASPEALAHHEQWRSRGERLRLDWAYGRGQGVRLRRVWRRDPVRARSLAADVLVRGDLNAMRGALRDRYVTGFVAGLARLGGTVRGAASERPPTSPSPPHGRT